jgi:hypothetical protein
MLNGNDQPPSEMEIEAAKRRDETRELVLAYKRCFTSESGRRVLADLCAKFGFDKKEHENSSFIPGASATDVAWRDGSKDPVRHILKMRDVELKPLGAAAEKRKAKSGLAPRA